MNAFRTEPLRVPAGVVPPYKAFARQVWRYRDANGHTVLCPPPDVFTLTIDDANDAACVRAACKLLHEEFDFGTRVEIRWVNGSHHVVFHDLEVLHTFIRLLTARSQRDRSASDVAAFILGSLGFRWS